MMSRTQPAARCRAKLSGANIASIIVPSHTRRSGRKPSPSRNSRLPLRETKSTDCARASIAGAPLQMQNSGATPKKQFNSAPSQPPRPIPNTRKTASPAGTAGYLSARRSPQIAREHPSPGRRCKCRTAAQPRRNNSIRHRASLPDRFRTPERPRPQQEQPATSPRDEVHRLRESIHRRGAVANAEQRRNPEEPIQCGTEPACQTDSEHQKDLGQPGAAVSSHGTAGYQTRGRGRDRDQRPRRAQQMQDEDRRKLPCHLARFIIGAEHRNQAPQRGCAAHGGREAPQQGYAKEKRGLLQNQASEAAAEDVVNGTGKQLRLKCTKQKFVGG